MPQHADCHEVKKPLTSRTSSAYDHGMAKGSWTARRRAAAIGLLGFSLLVASCVGQEVEGVTTLSSTPERSDQTTPSSESTAPSTFQEEDEGEQSETASSSSPGTTSASVSSTTSRTPTPTTQPQTAFVVVENVRLFHGISGDPACTVEVEVFNNGPGTATGTEVRIELSSQLTGGLSTGEITLNGPATIEPGETAFYGTRLGIVPLEGEPFLFEGLVDVQGEQDYEFFSPNNVGITCE